LVIPISTAALAQGQDPNPGLSLDSFKSFFDPIATTLAWIPYGAMHVWLYLTSTPPAAVLLSTIIASTVAIVSIHNNRATTKLRETYSKINAFNWDQDVIEARKIFTEIKQKLTNPQEIAKYCHPLQQVTGDNPSNYTQKLDSHEKISGLLRSIANDYEFMALGIKMDILDEEFVYRAARGALIRDWAALSPLVIAYRQRHNSQLVYIEFEGLTHAWEQDKSYRSGRKMRPARKRIFFK
jgi:hypothetical protein